MEYTNAAWLQAPQIPDLQSVHDERTSATNDDWKDQAGSVQGGGINDLLGDLQGEHDTLLGTDARHPRRVLALPLPCSFPSSSPQWPCWLVKLPRSHLLHPTPVSQSHGQPLQHRVVWCSQLLALTLYRAITSTFKLLIPQWRDQLLFAWAVAGTRLQSYGHRVRSPSITEHSECNTSPQPGVDYERLSRQSSPTIPAFHLLVLATTASYPVSPHAAVSSSSIIHQPLIRAYSLTTLLPITAAAFDVPSSTFALTATTTESRNLVAIRLALAYQRILSWHFAVFLLRSAPAPNCTADLSVSVSVSTSTSTPTADPATNSTGCPARAFPSTCPLCGTTASGIGSRYKASYPTLVLHWRRSSLTISEPS